MSATTFLRVPQSASWAHWSGGTVTDIYTDGSHAMDKTLGQLLLGKGSSKNGGGIILTDGRSWINRIFVRIDLEVKKAFQVELICILIANAIAVAQGGRVTTVRGQWTSATPSTTGPRVWMWWYEKLGLTLRGLLITQIGPGMIRAYGRRIGLLEVLWPLSALLALPTG